MTDNEIDTVAEYVLEREDLIKKEFLEKRIRTTSRFIENYKIDIMNKMHAFFITLPEIEFETELEYVSKSIDVNDESIKVLEEQINNLTKMLITLNSENTLLILLHNELFDLENKDR